MKKQRYTVYYRGQVQGVGFRYTVCQLAGGFDVKGFVRNLSDGRVQIVAEGPIDELDRFVKAVQVRMSTYIRDHELDQQDPTGEFSDFGLRW